MQRNIVILALLVVSVAAKAEEPTWFVSVFGENMQLASGASANAEVADGVFLNPDFVGTVIFVRVQEGYELDGFRPADSTPAAAAAVSMSESADAAASAAASDEVSMDEFGPLSDSGLQVYQNGDFFGWICAQLYVQPLGGRVYRLRCDESMAYTG